MTDPYVIQLAHSNPYPLSTWQWVHSILGHRSDWPELAQWGLNNQLGLIEVARAPHCLNPDGPPLPADWPDQIGR